MGMDAIDKLTKDYADARHLLSERVGALQAEIDDAKRRKVPGIKTAIVMVAAAYAGLATEVDAHRELFERPRSVVLHGVKVGLQKGRGAVSCDDEARTLRLIRRHLPEQADVLIQTKESVRKGALAALTVDELKRIGCEAATTGDVVMVKATDSEVDKLVKALLKGIEDEREED